MKHNIHIIATIFFFFFIQNEVSSQAQLLQTSGKINFLRVHEVGSKYGPSNDQIDAEVVIKFVGNSSKAYGFKLRKDNNHVDTPGNVRCVKRCFQLQS